MTRITWAINRIPSIDLNDGSLPFRVNSWVINFPIRSRICVLNLFILSFLTGVNNYEESSYQWSKIRSCTTLDGECSGFSCWEISAYQGIHTWFILFRISNICTRVLILSFGDSNSLLANARYWTKDDFIALIVCWTASVKSSTLLFVAGSDFDPVFTSRWANNVCISSGGTNFTSSKSLSNSFWG